MEVTQTFILQRLILPALIKVIVRSQLTQASIMVCGRSLSTSSIATLSQKMGSQPFLKTLLSRHFLLKNANPNAPMQCKKEWAFIILKANKQN